MEIKIFKDDVAVSGRTVYVEQGSARLSFSLPQSGMLKITDSHGCTRYRPIEDGEVVIDGLVKPQTLTLEYVEEENTVFIGTVKVRRIADVVRERYCLDMCFDEESDRERLNASIRRIEALEDTCGELNAQTVALKAENEAILKQINTLIRAINNPY